jgi:hypothetical protein
MISTTVNNNNLSAIINDCNNNLSAIVSDCDNITTVGINHVFSTLTIINDCDNITTGIWHDFSTINNHKISTTVNNNNNNLSVSINDDKNTNGIRCLNTMINCLNTMVNYLT